ncbi:MAG: ABC transporter permease [Thermomicrobia bacterium]|nr:ABC transporter permease [Thermomicrobia bacterium]MCA1722895.1 ABC transporter permease [Thermomicrobia bacterium]
MATISTAESAAFGIPTVRRERSPFVNAVLSLRRNPLAMAGIVVIALWLVIALVAPVVAPYEPNKQDIVHRLQGPNRTHFLGTDDLGRDIFSRVLYGARISVPAGILTILATGTIGIILGAFAGYVGGWLDNVIMRAADVVLAFPSIILAMAITALRGGPGISNALLAIILVLWPEYARVMRGAVLALKSNEYVTAAEAIGASRWRILMRHILPGTDAPIVVKATLDIGAAIILMAGLSFIGLGAVPPNPEWGAMINASIAKFQDWWLGTFPALAIISVVLSLNFIGDALRDALDPRLRGR